MRVTSALSVAALASLGACSDKIDLGLEKYYWSADFETGDLSQWSKLSTFEPLARGPSSSAEAGPPNAFTGGQAKSTGSASLTIVDTPVHSGNFAAKSAIDATGSVSFARLCRWGTLPQDAYYSVWMYIPTNYTIGNYWNLFEFQGRSDPADPATQVFLWSLDVARRSDGQMSWYVWDWQRSHQLNPAVSTVAPVGRWFRVEAFMHQATDNSGDVKFWVDGVLLLEASGVSTLTSDWLYWAVGGAAIDITEQPAEVFLDDAAILREGPGK